MNKQELLKQYGGKWLVLYFYPKDDTPGCTLEGIDFSKNKNKFESLGAEIIGVSPDSEKSHDGFCKKHSLKIKLVSDTEKTLLKEFGAWGKKKLYGREYDGVIRSTFIINPKGKIVASWKNVKVPSHVNNVLEKLKELKNS